MGENLFWFTALSPFYRSWTSARGGGEISASILPRVLKTECRWDPFHPEVSLSSDGRKEGVPESIGRRKLHRGLLWAKCSFI